MVIYLTTNIINNKKYVGKDSNNNPKYLGSGVLLLEEIKKYGKENFQKEILEICNSDEELTLRETYWIQKLNALYSDEYYNLVDYSAGWNLEKLGEEKYNYVVNKISLAGTGISKPTLKTDNIRKEKLRKANKGNPKPEGFGEKISQLKKGKKLSKNHCERIRCGKLGKKQPQSFMDKKYKPIVQLDINDNLIQEFKSTEEVTSLHPQFKRSNISCCLTGYSKTAYGFKWKYKKDYVLNKN
jgi:group I intron endonuclease